jgi:hypothetical protein
MRVVPISRTLLSLHIQTTPPSQALMVTARLTPRPMLRGREQISMVAKLQTRHCRTLFSTAELFRKATVGPWSRSAFDGHSSNASEGWRSRRAVPT